jgi:hypothetical protein
MLTGYEYHSCSGSKVINDVEIDCANGIWGIFPLWRYLVRPSNRFAPANLILIAPLEIIIACTFLYQFVIDFSVMD